MTPLYCSFFTGYGYADHARQLTETLNAFGLPHDVREIPDCGDWSFNCGRKASYLLTIRAENPGRPLVWVDADARIRRNPTLFNTIDCDVAACWINDELRSGTVYFSGNDAAGRLLEAWQDECHANLTLDDQKMLQRLLTGNHGYRFEALPIEYTAIFDEGVQRPVIEHMQASRKLRR